MICMQEKKREILSVPMHAEDKLLLDQVAIEAGGIKKLEMYSKILKWFVIQDKSLRAIILEQIDPADTIEILDLIKKRARVRQALDKVRKKKKSPKSKSA